MPDAISREAAKGPLSAAIAKAFESNAGNALDYFDEREMFRRDIEEVVLAALDALPAVEAEKQPEEASVEKPPMLYATVVGLTAKEQEWTRCGNVWQAVDSEERISSKRFQSVCVFKSAPAALQLFHEDLRKP